MYTTNQRQSALRFAAAALAYARLAEIAQADAILVPRVGVLDGVLLDLRAQMGG